MTLRGRLLAITLLPVAAAVWVGLVLWQARMSAVSAVSRSQVAYAIKADVNDLYRLTVDAVQLDEPGIWHLWRQQHEALGRSLEAAAFPDPDQAALLARIRQLHGEMSMAYGRHDDAQGTVTPATADRIQAIDRDLIATVRRLANAAQAARTRIVMEAIRNVMLILVVTGLFLVLASSVLSRGIAAAVHRLRKGTQAVAAGRFDVRVATDATDELGELARDFDRMTERLRESEARLNADVVQARHAERALAESETRFRAIFNGISDAAVYVSTDRRIQLVNPAFESVFGYTREEVLGRSTEFLYVDPADHAEQGRRWHSTSGELADSSRREIRYRRKDGSEFWSETLGLRIRDSDGTIMGFLGLHHDITSRREAEATVRRVALFPEQNPNPVLQVDTAGALLYANRPARSWLGSLGWEEAEPPPAPVLNVVNEVVQRGGEVQAEVSNDAGRTIWLVAVRPDGEGYVNLYGRDITDRNAAESELRRVTAQLAAANAELENHVRERTARLRETVSDLEHLSYSIAHDMRAPLRSLHGFAALLLEESVGCLTPQHQDYLRRITEAAERMDALIVDAMDYGKAVRQELPPASVDADALIRGMIASYPLFAADRADIAVEGSIPPVVANRAGLTQCVSYLLANAVRSVPPGTRATVRIRAERRGAAVRLWFEDNGPPIPKAQRDRIFEVFQWRSMPQSRAAGLSLVHKLAERMSGRLGAESRAGKGGVFWLEFKSAD